MTSRWRRRCWHSACRAGGGGAGTARAGRAAGRVGRAMTTREQMMHLRIGEGWDVHALVPGRRLLIGGVELEHPMGLGLLGHSDADVLLHAITDALLGAAALGDIGRHFPDTDAAFRAADSRLLLAEAARRVRAAGYEIGNIDSTVVAQAPRLAAPIPAMRLAIARALGVDQGQVNVKAKTAEGLGPVGQNLAIEARAVALICAPPGAGAIGPAAQRVSGAWSGSGARSGGSWRLIAGRSRRCLRPVALGGTTARCNRKRTTRPPALSLALVNDRTPPMRCMVLSTIDSPRPAPVADVRAMSPRKNGLIR